MPDIEIDTSQLTFPLFTIPGTTTGFVDGSKLPRPRISLPARAGYRLQQGSAALADFEFEVKDDGTVGFDEAFDGFVSGRGEPAYGARTTSEAGRHGPRSRIAPAARGSVADA